MVARFTRLPRRAEDTWQGGVVRMPMWVDGPDGTPYRPWGGVWVSLETGLVNVKLGEPGEDPGRLALDAMLELGFRFAQTRPSSIQVEDEALGAQIAQALADPQLGVTVVPRLDEVRTMLRRMEAETNPKPHPAPLDVKGVTVERMRAFAAAARDFYMAVPWRHLSDEDLIEVEAPSVAAGFRHLTVLGHAGHTFGVGFYASPEAYERVREASGDDMLVEGDGRWIVFFGPPWETPFADVDLWEEHGLPLAGPEAYPLAAWFGPSRRMRRANARELGDLEAILLALARSTEGEIDQGRWSHEVSTHDGPRRVTLAIPELLVPLDASPERATRGMPDRRAMERVLVEMQRFVTGREFASEAEMNEAVRERFSAPLDRVASTASTPVERAQDLIYRAFEARGRRRIHLAREALEISPDCADAYVLLAEECTDPGEARGFYAQAVTAAERALGPAVFAESAGRFWRDVRTRPYMRARLGLARCLEDTGQHEEALTHYRELLRLDPGDSLGVRYLLLAGLLLAGHDDEAGALQDRYGEDVTALWSYGRALWTFRREGDTPASRQRLRAAFRANRHVPGYLSGDTEWAGLVPDSYAMGSREEAIVVLDEQGEAWKATPGALEWLGSQAPAGKRRKRRRR
jgi:tetratricopeptide (TPR) repeat protein